MTYYTSGNASGLNKDLTVQFLENYSFKANYEDFPHQEMAENNYARNFKSSVNYVPVYESEQFIHEPSDHMESSYQENPSAAGAFPRVKYNEMPVTMSGSRLHQSSQLLQDPPAENFRNEPQRSAIIRPKPYSRPEVPDKRYHVNRAGCFVPVMEEQRSSKGIHQIGQPPVQNVEPLLLGRNSAFSIHQPVQTVENQTLEATNTNLVIPSGYEIFNISVTKTESGYQMSAPSGLSFTEEDVSNVIKAATTGEAIFKPNKKNDDHERPASGSSSFSDIGTRSSSSAGSIASQDMYQTVDGFNCPNVADGHCDTASNRLRLAQQNYNFTQSSRSASKSPTLLTRSNEKTDKQKNSENSRLDILKSVHRNERNEMDNNSSSDEANEEENLIELENSFSGKNTHSMRSQMNSQQSEALIRLSAVQALEDSKK